MAPRQPWEEEQSSVPGIPPERWPSITVLRSDVEAAVQFVNCPVCAALVIYETPVLARHVLWHHDHGEWPWAKM